MSINDPNEQALLGAGGGSMQQQAILRPGLDPNDPNVWHGPEYQPPPAPPSQAAGLIAAPPEGWQSNKQIYEQAGLGNGWIFNNEVENPGAAARTAGGPQMPHGVDPYTDIFYSPGANGTSGFNLGSAQGPDLFGGRKFETDNFPRDVPKLLPREAQAWLAPALMRYFYQNDYVGQAGSGITAPWTQQFAPTPPNTGRYPYESVWPGIAKYDPWHRQVGSYANLYS